MTVPSVEPPWLESAAVSLRDGRDLRRLLQDVTDTGVRLTGAEYGAFFYSGQDEHGERLDLYVLSGIDHESMPHLAPVRHTPLFSPTFSGEGSVRVDDVLSDPRYGHNASRGVPAQHVPVRSYLACPVVDSSSSVLGALLFGHREPGRFDAAAEEVALSVASQAAVAIDNALLFAAERAARAEAEAAARRLALMQHITALLSTAASSADIVERVPLAVTEALQCSSTAVYLHDERLGVLTGRPSSSLPADTARALTSIPVSADSPSAQVFRERRPIRVRRRDVDRYRDLAGRDLGDLSQAVFVPLLDSDHRCLGTLNVYWAQAADWSQDDTDLLVGVANQVALALERARLFDAERAAREQLALSVGALTELARTLQHGLLPARIPDLERVGVAVRYQPAVAGAEVGGDWYDAVVLGDRVIFVIGDVQGHSTTAAGLMGQLRTAVRAYLREGHDPAAALERTNRMMADLGSELFATCCLLQLDERTGELLLASAGHPAPLAASPRGVDELTVVPGLPLGVLDEATYETTRHRLRERTHVVLYTDGVVEAARTPITEGVEALADTLRRSDGATAEALADAVLKGIPHRLTDDAAVLVLDYAGPVAARREAALPLLHDVKAVGQARRFLRSVLAAWDLSSVEDSAELVVSELVTNAVVHTEAPSDLELWLDTADGRLRISVGDASSRHPQGRSGDLDALGGRGLHIVAALAADWGVSARGDGKTVWAELEAPALLG